MDDKILEKLREWPSVNDVIVSNLDVSLVVDDAEALLPQIMDFFKENSIVVKRASITKPTLDDVFLKYAGARLDMGGRLSEVTHVRKMIGRG